MSGPLCSWCRVRRATVTLDDPARTVLCVECEHQRRARYFEERNRATKAYKLSRVLLAALASDRGFTIDEIAGASPESRRIAARIAKVRMPSAQTWAVMIDLLREQAR